MIPFLITTFIITLFLGIAGAFIFSQYKKVLREAKNYERGLKMVAMYIHIPPSSDDLEGNGRDERDVTEEVLSQAQVMYNIIASTATKGFKSKVYGQRHLSLEIVAHEGLVHYYAVVPTVLIDVVRQAISAAYPSARLEEVEERNIFNQAGKLSGTIGGEFTLKKNFVYPIATYQESKRDAARALLNALSSATREDGIAIQLLLRPANDGWAKNSIAAANKIKKDKGQQKSGFGGAIGPKDLMEALWKPPESSDVKPEDKQLTSLEQSLVEAIEEKTRHPGYEVLIRVVVSSNTAAQSQALLKNVVAAFSLFDSTTNNGFRFNVAKDIEELVTAYIFRFFPQTVTQNVLNSVELASLFHLPDQNSIPTSQVQRQMAKQVDGPTQVMDEGFLLGYNEFRGIKKQIRLSTNDRRRHTYMIGQTGTGKSKLLENLAFQDMMDGKGFAFIDPHGDSVDELLGMVPKERVEDVIYFSPADMDNPIGLNLFEFENQDQRDFLIQETIAMLYRLYDPGHTGIIGPRYEHWFRNAALTIMSDPHGSTFIDVPQVFNDPSFTDEKIKYVTDRTVLDFWNKEMAQTSDANKSEVLGWFVSKFGAFLSNEMMRNVIGQTKSGFNLRDVMDNKKILLVNLAKGRTGELNSQLLGMIFVMKFQAAAMGRANIPESERQDFALYVDEFQNFATDSFESILSEARKYRLNLVLANQFMTQLTDKIREAIIGNIGTVISGRIGITDAELLQKKFAPTFDAEDLTKLPNFQTIASVMINNVPSSAFSMSLLPPMGVSNAQLRDALKKLSAAKYGRPRAQVEKEIFARLGAGDVAKKVKLDAMKKAQQERMGAARQGAAPANANPAGGGSSFLDEWLAKRQQIAATPSQSPPKPAEVKDVLKPQPLSPASVANVPATQNDKYAIKDLGSDSNLKAVDSTDESGKQTPRDDKFHIRGDQGQPHDEVSVKLR
ncbi:TraM recognition domain-containing protein [Candidatus Saccharibacteria bacterium]|nr:TraM recognition domain-containing protein [Candidatus Saccharibacteria bacterium]